MDIVKSVIVAISASLFCIWLLRPLAHKVGFVDRPGGRKLHEGETPLIGGIAMFFGFFVALLSLPISLQHYRGLFAGSALLILMGVVDDFKELGSRLRLIGQILAAIILISWGHVIVQHLGNLFFLGPVNLYMWAYPITIVAVVGYLNAMNMLDGQDGLAGGIALGQVILLMLLNYQIGNSSNLHLLILLAVLLLVFLAFNMRMPWRHKASIFMGDSGATFIAFLIAWFAIHLSQRHGGAIHPITVLWILAFPLFDLVNVMTSRIRAGKSPLRAGRDHIHHMLHVVGFDARISTLLLCLLSIVLGAIGIVLNDFAIQEGWQVLGLFAALFCYLLLVRIARKPGLKNKHVCL